jgi:PadR family transcriptional regulator, regulatory protein PadR
MSAAREFVADGGQRMKIERELMRGAGPLAVLKLLEKREMYGYELVEEIASKTEGVLAMGQSTLYPMLYNLEAKGLIEATWRDAPAGAGGTRERKYYKLTLRGRKRLQADQQQYAAVAGALAKLGVIQPGGAA